MRHHMVRGTLLLALAAGLTGSASCTMRDGAGNSYLIIESITGIRGQSGEEDSPLNSDVVAMVEKTVAGEEVVIPTIFEDGGLVTFRLALKDPGSATVPTVATSNNFITLTRYHVEYTRADGRNTPGVDVPFGFDSMTTATVVAEGSTEVPITLVRLQAKAEAPLLALRGGRGQAAISAIARITFYGQDQAGKAVSVTGYIGIEFADWADEE